VSFIEIGSINK